MNIFLINILIFLMAGSGCLIVGGIVLNNPPIQTPPGFGKRLLTYLTMNTAETRHNHRFPELEIRCYPLPPTGLFTRVEHALAMLGWNIVTADQQQLSLHAVVETALLKFKDDIKIQLVNAPCGTELHIHSSSRVGRGDLGANTRHVMDLYTALSRQI